MRNINKIHPTKIGKSQKLKIISRFALTFLLPSYVYMRTKIIFTKKILISTLLVLLFYIVGSVGIYAYNFPESFNTATSDNYLTLINDNNTILFSDGVAEDTYSYPSFYHKYYDNDKNKSIICLSGLNVPRPTGETCTLQSTWSDSSDSYAIAYILSTISKGSKSAYEKYYWQEIIVFDYLGLLTGSNYANQTYNEQAAQIKQDFKDANSKIAGTEYTWNQIINQANSIKNDSTYASDATITVNGANSINLTFSLNEEDGYYYSQPVTVLTNTTSPTITPSNSKFKVDKSGNTYTFKIKATDIEPGKTERFSNIISVSKSYPVAARYDCGEGVQNFALVSTEQKQTTSSATISGQVTREYSVISKVSAVDGKELPGAKLEILNSNKESISCIVEDEDGNLETLEKCEWISTDEPKLVFELPEGKYYLKEILAPEGYELKETLVEFEVEKGKVAKPKMENDLEVEVPDTLSSRSALLVAIAMFDIALGIGIITYVKKNKVSE